MYEKYGYFANWSPNDPRQLGEVGTLDKNYFTHIDSLWNLNLDQKIFKVKQGEPLKEEEYASRGSVNVTSKIAGHAVPKGCNFLGNADAGVVLDFKKENSIYFNVKGSRRCVIDNQIALSNEIIKMCENNHWEEEWVVVTETVEVDSATILISSTKKTHVELKAKVSSTPGNMDIENEATNAQGLSIKLIAEKKITPLFKLMRITEDKRSGKFKCEHLYVDVGVEPREEAGRGISLEEVDFEPYEDLPISDKCEKEILERKFEEALEKGNDPILRKLKSVEKELDKY